MGYNKPRTHDYVHYTCSDVEDVIEEFKDSLELHVSVSDIIEDTGLWRQLFSDIQEKGAIAVREGFEECINDMQREIERLQDLLDSNNISY